MSILKTACALTVFCLMCPTAIAQEAQPDRLFLLGAGAAVQTTPYATAKNDTEVQVSPVFVFQQGRFSADLSGIGITAFEGQGLSLSARVNPRLPLMDPSDTEAFKDLDRKFGVDLGGQIQFERGPFSARLSYLADISDQSEGQEVSVEMSWRFQPTSKLSLEVNSGVSWQDEALSTWLYGIGTQEAGDGPVYDFGQSPNAPSGGQWVPSIGAQARYQITDRLFLMGGVETEFYGSDITDSPLMDDDTTLGTYVGLMRRF